MSTPGTVPPPGTRRVHVRVVGILGLLLVAALLAVATPTELTEIPVAAPTALPTSVPSPTGPVGPEGPEGRAWRDAISAAVDHRAPAATAAGDVATSRDGVGAIASAGPSTLERSAPTRVHIPAIGVDSELVALGLRDDGQMEVPAGAFPAGWFTGAPTPGELGPAVLAGHVDYGGIAGVFHRLRDLTPGDTVEIARVDGTTAVFRVTRVEQHRKDAFPTAAVYGDIDHAGLRLITCGGSFDRGRRSYVDNIVVFAELEPAG